MIVLILRASILGFTLKQMFSGATITDSCQWFSHPGGGLWAADRGGEPDEGGGADRGGEAGAVQLPVCPGSGGVTDGPRDLAGPGSRRAAGGRITGGARHRAALLPSPRSGDREGAEGAESPSGRTRRRGG